MSVTVAAAAAVAVVVVVLVVGCWLWCRAVCVVEDVWRECDSRAGHIGGCSDCSGRRLDLVPSRRPRARRLPRLHPEDTRRQGVHGHAAPAAANAQ